MRLRLARPRLTVVLTDGPAWIVDVGDAVIAPTKQLSIARSIAGKNRASIAIPFADARKVHRITDPAVGDRLMVITALAPARGFSRGRFSSQLRALPSTHGVVVQALADDLSAESRPTRSPSAGRSAWRYRRLRSVSSSWRPRSAP